MSIGQKLRSNLILLLLRPRMRSLRRAFVEWCRRLTGRTHVVQVFIELDDPYSYLLSCYLPELATSYDVEVRLHLTNAVGGEHRPRPDLLAAYAEQDCERLARELGVPFLDRGRAPPVEHRRALIESLAEVEEEPNDAEEILHALSLYWRGDAEGVARRVSGIVVSQRGEAMLARNQRLLQKLGHYNVATIYYAGEWYWGIDRLHYLCERLDAVGAARAGGASARLSSVPQAMQMTLPVTRPSAARDLPPLEYFYSFRSPYSYLSLGRVFAIADAFGLELRIRPVLPMVMRGMQVPRSKLRYIVTDAAREAERLGIPFGRFADPAGDGIERCMAVFTYAVGERRERDFLQNAGEAVWARGIDVSTDAGMRKVTGRTGLFWPDVLAAMADDSWRDGVDENRETMMESGSWGVPTLRLGEFVVWGQDRLWMLVRHIEELCDTGDGILI